MKPPETYVVWGLKNARGHLLGGIFPTRAMAEAAACSRDTLIYNEDIKVVRFYVKVLPEPRRKSRKPAGGAS